MIDIQREKIIIERGHVALQLRGHFGSVVTLDYLRPFESRWRIPKDGFSLIFFGRHKRLFQALFSYCLFDVNV